MRHGKKYRVSLVDGTALEGTLRWSWGWWSFRLTDVIAHNQQGSFPAEGYFIVPRRSVHFVQAVGD